MHHPWRHPVLLTVRVVQPLGLKQAEAQQDRGAAEREVIWGGRASDDAGQWRWQPTGESQRFRSGMLGGRRHVRGSRPVP